MTQGILTKCSSTTRFKMAVGFDAIALPVPVLIHCSSSSILISLSLSKPDTKEIITGAQRTGKFFPLLVVRDASKGRYAAEVNGFTDTGTFNRFLAQPKKGNQGLANQNGNPPCTEKTGAIQ